MSTQPKALRLANALEAWTLGKPTYHRKAAVELRRLHAENETLRQQPAFDALVAISLLTHLGGEVAEYADVVEAVRRLHALNGELLEALKYHQEQTRPIERTRAAIARAEGQA